MYCVTQPEMRPQTGIQPEQQNPFSWQLKLSKKKAYIVYISPVYFALENVRFISYICALMLLKAFGNYLKEYQSILLNTVCHGWVIVNKSTFVNVDVTTMKIHPTLIFVYCYTP